MSKNVEPGQLVYIAKINENGKYAPPKVTEPWRANAYYEFMIMNGKPKDGKVYTYPGYKVTLLPWHTHEFPSFCISKNEKGLKHILSNDLDILTDFVRRHNHHTPGGKRTKRNKRTKRTKRNKRIHSIKRK